MIADVSRHQRFVFSSIHFPGGFATGIIVSLAPSFLVIRSHVIGGLIGSFQVCPSSPVAGVYSLSYIQFDLSRTNAVSR